jgi:hypothetical protein
MMPTTILRPISGRKSRRAPARRLFFTNFTGPATRQAAGATAHAAWRAYRAKVVYYLVTVLFYLQGQHTEIAMIS